jgi:hypothetical protein
MSFDPVFYRFSSGLYRDPFKKLMAAGWSYRKRETRVSIPLHRRAARPEDCPDEAERIVNRHE